MMFIQTKSSDGSAYSFNINFLTDFLDKGNDTTAIYLVNSNSPIIIHMPYEKLYDVLWDKGLI